MVVAISQDAAKAARLALRAFEHLNRKNVTLVISGEGPDRPYQKTR